MYICETCSQSFPPDDVLDQEGHIICRACYEAQSSASAGHLPPPDDYGLAGDPTPAPRASSPRRSPVSPRPRKPAPPPKPKSPAPLLLGLSLAITLGVGGYWYSTRNKPSQHTQQTDPSSITPIDPPAAKTIFDDTPPPRSKTTTRASTTQSTPTDSPTPKTIFDEPPAKPAR